MAQSASCRQRAGLCPAGEHASMNTASLRPLVAALILVSFAAAARPSGADSTLSTRIADPEKTRQQHSPPKRVRTGQDFVLRELDLREGDVVVDIGAGDGFWSEGMARFVGATGVVHAAEVDQRMIDRMTKRFAARPQVRPYLCPTDGPGLPARSCDLVFISDTYHHFDSGTQVTYLQGLRSVLKPSGRLAIIERYIEAGLGQGEHGTVLSRLIREAEQSGWVPLRVQLIPGTYHYLAIFAQKDLYPPEPPPPPSKSGPKAGKKV